jgi:hypothetical protein
MTEAIYEAFCDGAIDCAAGLARDLNPYEPVELHQAWNKGWDRMREKLAGEPK